MAANQDAHADRGLILIVDDLKPERLVIAHHVKSLGYRSISVNTGSEALEVMRKQPVDLVLLDILMPEMDGFAVLGEMKGDPQLAMIPVVVISGTDPTNAARSIVAGAEDFITKPFDPRLLHARIRNSLEQKRSAAVQRAQLEQVKRLQEQLEHTQRELKEAQLSMDALAFQDTLTGLPNRRAGVLMLQQAWALATRGETRVGCIVLDMDLFEGLNDLCGWDAGDAVLRVVAERLRAGVRDGDLLFRAGGDRFALVCFQTDLDECFARARLLHAAVTDTPVEHRDRSLRLQASLGLTCREAGHGESSAELLLSAAESCLTVAKAEGRNQIFAPGLVARAAPQPSGVLDADRLRGARETAEASRENPESLRGIAREAAEQLDAPVGVITLIEADRQLLLAKHGLPESMESTSLDMAVCPRIVVTGQPLRIDHAAVSPEWQHHPAVESGFIQAYLGVPLAQADGQVLGSLCVVDQKPRTWNEADRSALEQLAERTMHDVQRRRAAARAARGTAPLELSSNWEAAQQQRPINLLASASHELRTPLNGINGMCELLAATPLNEQQREYVNLLSLSTASLLDTVNDVLELAKSQSPSFALHPGPVDLREMVTAALKPLALRILGEKLDFQLSFDPALAWKVRLDATRLRQILVNLVGNSAKFTVHGGIRVRVAPAPEGLAFVVQDTGIGVPTSRLRDIFEPFQQVNGPLQDRYRGTGLGLPITRQLCEAMGGQISCESQERVGTTFRVLLPCEVVQARPEPLPLPLGLLVGELQRSLLTELLAPWQVQLTAGPPDQPALVEVSDEDAALAVCRARSAPTMLLCRPGWQPLHAELARLPRCSWPVLPSEPLAWLKPVAAAPAAKEPAAPRRRILVVDDNPTNRRVACGLLRRLGNEVAEAALPSLGLQQLREAEWDLVLVDLEMPEMDGFEFARRATALLQETGGTAELVACSAHTDSNIRARCREAGMARYLAKPIGTAELKELLSGSRSHPSG